MVLRQVTEQYPNTPWYKRALFLTEQAFIRMDIPSGADATMLRAQSEYSELADYAVFMLAEYHFEKRRYTQAAALYQRIVEQYPVSSLSARSAFRRAQALLESCAYVQAVEAFENFLRDNPRSENAAAAGMGLGRALTAEARLTEAVRKYQEAWVKYPGSPVDQDVEKALAGLAAGGVQIPELTAEELYERGKNLYRSTQYEKAIEAFMKVVKREPDSPYRADSLLRAGISAFHIGRRTDAARILEKMMRNYPEDPRVPEALNWLGKSYSKLGEWDKGVAAFRRILDRFPESEWADDALFLIGNIYREAGDMKKALRYYKRLAEEYPDSKFADSAIWWNAWTNYSAGDYHKAEHVLRELMNRYPRSFLVNQARYWQGRSAEKRGDSSQAAAYYRQALKKAPYTYYGYRAAERMTSLRNSDVIVNADVPVNEMVLCEEVSCPDDPLHSYDMDMDEGPPVWTEETRTLLAADPLFRKTLELMHVDMKKEAAAELWALQEKRPRKRGTLIGLSKAFFELGDYYRSFMLVLGKYDRYLERPLDGTPEDLWQLAYPQAYWEKILFYSRKYRLEPYFVAAVIREESRFNTEALSSAGARGLMQVMPSTGARVAQSINMRGFEEGKLHDSDTSINIGTWYIGYLMKRFKGNLYLVAAAYNAGPEAVASWINKNGKGRDGDVFVESIPYSETRGYVKKVLRNYAEYKRIYGRTADIAPVTPVLSGDAPRPVITDNESRNP